jgi:outer membrane protein TolC
MERLHILLLFSFITPLLRSQPQPVTLDQCIEAALTNNPTLKEAANTSSRAAVDVNIARSGRFTSVSTEIAGGFSDRYSSGNNYETGYARIRADQMVWQKNRVNAAIEQARLAVRATDASFDATKQEIILSVKTLFYVCQQQQQLQIIAGENVTRAGVYLQYARERVNAGLGRRSEVLKAESDLAEAIFDQNTTMNTYRKVLNDLAMLTYLPSDQLANHAKWEADTLANSVQSKDSIIKMALTHFPELQVILNLRSSQESKIKEVRAARYPGVFLNTGYEWNYNPLTDDQKGWYALVTLRWDIFNGNANRYREKLEYLKKENYNYQAEVMQNYVVREVSNRIISLLETVEQINLTRSLLKTTRENLAVAQGQYIAGTGSILELTDARLTDLQTQKNNVQAVTGYKIALANLERLTGKTFEKQ